MRVKGRDGEIAELQARPHFQLFADDYLRFTSILAQQKAKLPFYLYAYSLMPNPRASPEDSTDQFVKIEYSYDALGTTFGTMSTAPRMRCLM